MGKNDAENLFVIDIKGELHRLIPDDLYYLIDPQDRRHSYGWDPYYRLYNEPTTPDHVINILSGISRSLIHSDNPRDSYFVENAISILTGILAYGFSRGIGLPDMVNRISTENIQQLIMSILEDSEDDSIPKRFLGKYAGKKSDGFEDIVTTMTKSLSCFSLQDVQYMLRDNPRRLGPDALLEKNVFLAITDNVLTEQQFSPIFRMILEQEMQFLVRPSPVPNRQTIGLIIDEFYALGKISSITHFLSICRGYGVYACICTQSMAGIEELYGRDGARIITENCRGKVILECTDPQTSQSVIDWSGTYHEKIYSHSTGKGGGTISYQVRNIFEKADFAGLAERQKIIVITPSGMNQVGKLQWFKSHYFTGLHNMLNGGTHT